MQGNKPEPKTSIAIDCKTVPVTGSLGFIDAHLVLRLLGEMGCDTIVSPISMNYYFDPTIKMCHLSLIEATAAQSRIRHVFIRGSIVDKDLLKQVFSDHAPTAMVNLAAQAGVRYSIERPDAYIESSIIGFYIILEACRNNPVNHLAYASSSSVCGGNKK